MPLLAKNRKYVACSIEQNFATAFPKEIVIDPAKKSSELHLEFATLHRQFTGSEKQRNSS